MATQSNAIESDEKAKPVVGVYQTAENQALRKWLGISETPRELPPLNWIENDEWRQGRGMLSDHPNHDTSEMKANNRAEEEEHDARKFGRSPRV
jgi:hypothetical protein